MERCPNWSNQKSEKEDSRSMTLARKVGYLVLMVFILFSFSCATSEKNRSTKGLLEELDRRIEQVLPPWTPVEVGITESGSTTLSPYNQVVDVKVWGRTYSFQDALLPTSITIGNKEILASPIRLVGTMKGKPIQWKREGAFLFKHDKAQATVSGWQNSKDLIVNTTSKVEYDGMMRVDLVVMSRPRGENSAELDKLWLEIPIKEELASLFHFWPRRGTALNSGAVPDTGLTLPFRPLLWLGWEQEGLSWFAESDEGWQPRDPSKCIEIVKKEGKVVLRLHLLDAQAGKLPLTLTFGFQATPVKPIPKNFHDWRICHGAGYGIEDQPYNKGTDRTILDRIEELGVKTLVFHGNWQPVQNYGRAKKGAKLRSLVSACHRHGIKLLLYFGYELSSLAPEWGKLADQVLQKTPQGDLIKVDGTANQSKGIIWFATIANGEIL